MIEELPVVFPGGRQAFCATGPRCSIGTSLRTHRGPGSPYYLVRSTRGNFPRLARTLPFSRHLGGLFAERSARVPSGWTFRQLSWRIKERG